MTDEEKYEAMIEAMAWADAEFDGRPFDRLGRADRDRYLARKRAAAEAIGLKPGCVVVDTKRVPAWMEAAGAKIIRECEGGHLNKTSVAAGVFRAMIAESRVQNA